VALVILWNVVYDVFIPPPRPLKLPNTHLSLVILWFSLPPYLPMSYQFVLANNFSISGKDYASYLFSMMQFKIKTFHETHVVSMFGSMFLLVLCLSSIAHHLACWSIVKGRMGPLQLQATHLIHPLGINLKKFIGMGH